MDLLIGVVGACASGKSTLIRGLTQMGYSCRHIAQEHSYVKDMWQRLTKPDILIFLEVSYEVTIRRKQLNWSRQEFNTQVERISHAREHAHLVINTDQLTPEELVKIANTGISALIQNIKKENN